VIEILLDGAEQQVYIPFMRDPIKQTDKLISKLSESPLWVFGWGLFLTSLTFIGSVVLDLNEQNANIAKYNALSHTYQLNDRKKAGTIKALELVLGATNEASLFFNNNIQSQNDIASIPGPVLDKGLELIDTARAGVNTETGVLSALHFDDSGLNQFVDGFKSDLNALDKLLKTKELIYKKIKAKNFEEAKSQLAQLETQDYAKERQLSAASIRAEAFDTETQLKAEEANADLQLHQAHVTSYKLKLYLLLPMSMIVGAFAVIVIRKFRSVVT
jgi:hypothetical protein